MSHIDHEQAEALRRLLGRDITADEECCAGFGELSDSHLLEIGRLAHGGARLYAILYLRYLIGRPASLRNAVSFVERVIIHKDSISEWQASHFHDE
jgi:hypothetical protein